MDWTALAVIAGLVINGLGFAYVWGTLVQRVKTLEGQRGEARDVVNANRKELHDQIETQSHVLLPQCSETFAELRVGMAEIKGGLNTLVTLLKEKNK